MRVCVCAHTNRYTKTRAYAADLGLHVSVLVYVLDSVGEWVVGGWMGE